ncbi:MAG: metal-sulfur cluster assembly factor [Candidatus Aenigmarchaeota archaeon]|nr:metal-sulfur cluster assembly factor [Candidatus Aenigmarchaeota archaeon]
MVTKEEVMKALSTVKDVETGFDIVEMGLITGVEIKGDYVKVKMTLTTPLCPYAGYLFEETEKAVKKLKGVKKVEVEYDWEHPWTPEMASERIRKMLGI